MTRKDAKVFVGFIAAIGTAIPIVSAAAAVADPPDPWEGCNVSPPTSACKTTPPGIVPGMNRAEVGDSCTDTEHFIFAASSTGETLACRGKPAHYVHTAEVIGVRQDGIACSEQGLAQSPDGLPLKCITRNGRLLWTVSLDVPVIVDLGAALPSGAGYRESDEAHG